MESAKLLESLFDKKTLNILKLFLNKKDQNFYLREIAKSSRVPLSTTFRIVNKLVELEIVKQIKIKKFKIYGLNENEKTRYLEGVLEEKKTIVDEFVEKASALQGVKMIILYGKKEKDKSTLFLLGEKIDNDALRAIVVEIKEKYNYSITHLTLTEQQYNEMAAIGLYTDKKEIMFEKAAEI